MLTAPLIPPGPLAVNLPDALPGKADESDLSPCNRPNRHAHTRMHARYPRTFFAPLYLTSHMLRTA